MNKQQAEDVAGAIRLFSGGAMGVKVQEAFEVRVEVCTPEGPAYYYLEKKIDGMDFIRERLIKTNYNARSGW